MGHSRSAVVLVYFITLFIGALMTFYPVCVRVCALSQLCPTLIGIVCVCVSQLCARRSASTAAACLQTRASASLGGGGWTAPVVSALNS